VDVVTGNLIEYVENLVTDKEVVVFHNANCQCRMGAGIARDIARAWPEVEEVDNATIKGDSSKLGYWSSALVERNGRRFTVYNLYCQDRYGPAWEHHFDYTALNWALARMAMQYTGRDALFVFPLVGTGHAGGRWPRVRDIITARLTGFQQVLVKLPPERQVGFPS
jgi:O-acetyl-ADP-ribose deacetylase (regulator of RNase III)